MTTAETAARPRRVIRGLRRQAGWTIANLLRRDDVRRALCDLSPALLARLRYRQARGRWPDLEHPQDFDEKLLWLMLNDRDPLKTRCTDKLAARSWLAAQGFGDLLPRVHGVWARARDIDFAALPERVALKCTHGCGYNLFRRSRDSFDEKAARRQLDAWLAIEYETRLGEIHYRGIPPRILAEELLEQEPGTPPNDYKVFCFNGRPGFTVVCSGRRPGREADYDAYDHEWRRVPLCSSGHAFERPPGHALMLKTAERIARHFRFVRVDFYSIGDRILLGELTFTPAGCLAVFCDADGRMELGRMLRIADPELRTEN